MKKRVRMSAARRDPLVVALVASVICVGVVLPFLQWALR